VQVCPSLWQSVYITSEYFAVNQVLSLFTHFLCVCDEIWLTPRMYYASYFTERRFLCFVDSATSHRRVIVNYVEGSGRGQFKKQTCVESMIETARNRVTR
jgi:hypothetical protein